MLIYVAGPYRGEKVKNVANARAVAVDLWKLGHAVICPHLNNINMEEDGLTSEQMIRGDLQMIARCDMVFFLQGWSESLGSKEEMRYCKAKGIPFEFQEDGKPYPKLHLTEQKSPKQCRRFAEIAGQMYRLHMSKNEDYSPANIHGTGFIGVLVRLWDKVARVMNLSGFMIIIRAMPLTWWARIEQFWCWLWQRPVPIRVRRCRAELRLNPDTAIRKPQHEKVEDTLLDLANYAVIALLLREDSWGK